MCELEVGSQSEVETATSAGIISQNVALFVPLVETRAALAAAARGKRLSTDQLHVAKTELAAFVGDLHLVEVNEQLVGRAAQLVETASLRGYDAVHLAAAVFVGAAVLTSSDRALCDAAERQGLHIADPLTV